VLKNILKGSILYILILVFVVPVIILVLFANAAKKGIKTNSVGTPTAAPAQQNVPLPTREDIVRTFCNLIDEGRISEAVGMMDITDDTVKQSWGVYLNNFSSFKLVNIKSSAIEGTGNSFEVDINVTLKKNLTDLPIPNYGWVTGMNKRWINLTKKENGLYKISEIATGP
jgi:hypothetical protein